MTMNTLVERLEESFESVEAERHESKTLAEAVSNSLMPLMPRISPELFDLKRNAKITLTPEQKRSIISSYLERGCEDSGGFCIRWVDETGNSIRSIDDKNILSLECVAKIPSFAYTLHDERNAIYPKSACISTSFAHMLFPIKRKDSEVNSLEIKGEFINRRYCDIYLFFPHRHIGKNDIGDLKVVVQVEWKAPYKLDTVVNTPHIPESFVELGDEAISRYYQIATELPKNLRKKTSLVSPRIGVLWRPTDESLYVTGEVPIPTILPLPKHDPALILDIPDGERRYRHVVAAWNIGE